MCTRPLFFPADTYPHSWIDWLILLTEQQLNSGIESQSSVSKYDDHMNSNSMDWATTRATFDWSASYDMEGKSVVYTLSLLSTIYTLDHTMLGYNLCPCFLIQRKTVSILVARTCVDRDQPIYAGVVCLPMIHLQRPL